MDDYQRIKKERHRISSKKWRTKYPNKTRDIWLRRNYGITLNEYDVILIKQNNVCALCKQPETEIVKRTGKIKSLAVDHNKITGVIRGLLCSYCNRRRVCNNTIESLTDTLNYLYKYEGEHNE